MEIVRHIERQSLALPKPILTMGSFDGIHLGHQALLRQVIQDARAQGGCAVVLTFEPHPLKVLSPGRAPRLILTHRDKLALLRSVGVDVVVIQQFNAAFAALEARDFVQRYLVDRLRVHKIWVGEDFRFGKGRRGRAQSLIRWGSEAGFEVQIIPPVSDAGGRISSSQIRSLIGRGEMHSIRRLLGRYHFITGRVVAGRRRGRDLGFPTANINSRTELLPPDGIYATFLRSRDHTWPSVTNIGHNPTFGEGPRTVESYILHFDGDLYGETVRLSFVKKIREERKFPSADLLVNQMERDVVSAQEVFREVGSGGSSDVGE